MEYKNIYDYIAKNMDNMHGDFTVPRFGQGSPRKLNWHPSVPPRIGITSGVIPVFSHAVFALSTKCMQLAMISAMFLY